ncbi:MAG: hypothetical protein EOO15_20560 [Chitinophagaceae bacterium]|nr:MAG: hypothetical protein EOO15_20560 [Chitinophagaceae bacterium]
MIRNFLSIVFILLTGLLAAQDIPDSLTPAQVRADLEYISRTIESVHPDPWHAISRARFHQLRDSLAATVTGTVASEEAYPLVARLCAALDEGHTHAWSTPLSSKIIKGKIPVFPVLLRNASENGFEVVADLSEDSLLRGGDRIVAINGQRTNQLFARFLTMYGGLEAWRRSRLQNDLLTLLHAAGVRSPYRIVFERAGKLAEVERSALPYSEFRKRREAWKQQHKVAPKESDYSFERLPGNIGLLNVNTMEGNPQAFWHFLETHFEQIKKEPVNGLLIDLRRNGGGNSLFGWYLLSFINKKPLRMSGDVYWKVSPEVRSWHARLDSAGRARLDSNLWSRYLARADGDVLVLPASAAEEPENNALRYDGPVAFLIGPHTFSSANMTAATVADFHLAPLIGEATGEPANDYGEVLYFDTPNARVNFGTSSKLFTRPNGNRADKSAVQPDILIQTSTVDGDAVLQAGQEWLHKKRS